MVEAAHERMTVEEFLEWCDHQEGRWELVDGVPRRVFPMERLSGEPHAMAGPTGRHQDLQRNASEVIRSGLRAPCRVRTTFAVRIDTNRSREPDAVAHRDSPEGDRMTTEPVLVVEVISPSTEREDRPVKLDEYKGLTTMREIWLVSSTRRWVQVWQRREDGRWIGEDVIGSGGFRSAVLAAEVGLEDLYAGVATDQLEW